MIGSPSMKEITDSVYNGEIMDSVYNLSISAMLRDASRKLSDGDFEAKMREYFVGRAGESMESIKDAEWPDSELLRDYLRFKAKIAVVDLLRSRGIQQTMKRFLEKRHSVPNLAPEIADEKESIAP